MSSIVKLLPKNIMKLHYYEPFIGGGAVLFHLQPKNATINDLNEELVNVYNVIKNDLDLLLEDLAKHDNNAEYFYKIRSVDRTQEFAKLTPVQRASRVVYLNKTCYNGLYRVNNAGEFNAPFGRYKNPNIVNRPTLKAVSNFLNDKNIIIECKDYTKVLEAADSKSFVYLDPPYYPISASSNFTGYVQGGWSQADQIRLKNVCDELNRKGAKFLLSNSSALFIKDLYKSYEIISVKATRAINSNASRRGEVEEVLVRNYE